MGADLSRRCRSGLASAFTSESRIDGIEKKPATGGLLERNDLEVFARWTGGARLTEILAASLFGFRPGHSVLPPGILVPTDSTKTGRMDGAHRQLRWHLVAGPQAESARFRRTVAEPRWSDRNVPSVGLVGRREFYVVDDECLDESFGGL